MKEELEKELHELSPFLADLKKQQKNEPFKTPRLYFDTLADKVIEKANAEKQGTVAPPQYHQHPSLSTRINGWLSIALRPQMALSALALVFVAVVGWYVLNTEKPTPVAQNEPSISVIDAPQNNDLGMGTTPAADVVKDPIIAISKEPKATHHGQPEITDSQTINRSPEVIKPVITHPKSGLTEEEIEEYLKEALVDEDLESIGGK